MYRNSPKLYLSYNRHWSRDSMSPVCGIFLRRKEIKESYLITKDLCWSSQILYVNIWIEMLWINDMSLVLNSILGSKFSFKVVELHQWSSFDNHCNMLLIRKKWDLCVFVAKRSLIRITRFLRKVIRICLRYKESYTFYLHWSQRWSQRWL